MLRGEEKDPDFGFCFKHFSLSSWVGLKSEDIELSSDTGEEAEPEADPCLDFALNPFFPCEFALTGEESKELEGEETYPDCNLGSKHVFSCGVSLEGGKL